MRDEKTYRCYYEADERDRNNIPTLFYFAKEYRLTEIDFTDEDDDQLDIFVRQWKDLPVKLKDENWKEYEMKYWTIYLTDWLNLIEVFGGWWEKEFSDWLFKCEEKALLLNQN